MTTSASSRDAQPHELACLAALGCAMSHIETSWVDPSATPASFEIHRVLAVALANHRSAEDAMECLQESSAMVRLLRKRRRREEVT